MVQPWKTAPPSAVPPPPPSAAPLLLALLVVYVTVEAAFLVRYRTVLIADANRRAPPEPFRDHPAPSDRTALLRRIVARLGRRGRRRGSSAGSRRVHRDFVESWFAVRRDGPDVPYERFSERLDRVGPGLIRPSPSLLRLARWPSPAEGRDGEDDDGGDSDRSSYESLPALGGECGGAEAEGVQDGGSVDGPRRGDCVKEPARAIPDDGPRRGNMNEFLSWAFFGTSHASASADPSKVEALESFYGVLEEEAGLAFDPGLHPSYRPRSFTLEDVRSLHRPYCVYAAVSAARGGTNLALRLLGFRRGACGGGLAYWHRPPDRGRRRGPGEGGKTPPPPAPPFLFFHGIAPGGHAPYVPMLLLGLLRGDGGGGGGGWRDRHVFLFENGPISYALGTRAVDEVDTVRGVAEAVARHVDGAGGPPPPKLTACGHSFGSCVVTWLLRSPVLRDRVGTVLLLDPVSILLSDPDVVVNFLYHPRGVRGSGSGDGVTPLGRLGRFAAETKIRLVASSEIGIETYLRRSFAWYNSELWLEDVPRSASVCVLLSGRDEIVNSREVAEEVACHNRRVRAGECGGPAVDVAVWEGAGHANCVTNPGRWGDMRERLRAAEGAGWR